MKTEYKHFSRRLARRATVVCLASTIVLSLTAGVAWGWWTATTVVPGNTITTGVWVTPYDLQLGTSLARHWDIKDTQPARVLPIAQRGASGAMFLDFGEGVRGNSNISPDVFRMVSTTAMDRAVTFTVDGEIAPFVTAVRFTGNRRHTTWLMAFATQRVSIKISIPDGAELRDYTGSLTVHVDGWADDVHLPMVVTVRAGYPEAMMPASTLPPSSPTPVSTPTATGSPSPTPVSTPTATPTSSTPPEPTPVATPAAP